jgi:ParB family chromosome partitioning protein
VSLLDRFVIEKLKIEAETIAAEGWKWIAVEVDFPYGHINGLRELEDEPADLTGEEPATLETLNAEYARTPTNCRMRSISVSEKSRRRGPSWRLDR